MKNTSIHADMRDELAQSALFDGTWLAGPDPVSEQKKHALLLKWSKYERIDGIRNIAKLGEGLELCAVQNPVTGGYALLQRAFNGRTYRVTADDCIIRDPETGVLSIGSGSFIEGTIDWDALDAHALKIMKLRGAHPFWDYDICGIKPISGPDQAEAFIRQADSAYEMQIAREMDGFGTEANVAHFDEGDAEMGF